VIIERAFEIIRTIPGERTFSLFQKMDELSGQSVIGKPGDGKYAFIHSCYVLLEKGKPKARAVLYQNPELFYKNKKAVAIGNYECVEDVNISKSLLNFIIQDAKNLNAAFLIGPMNGSTWENYRFSLHNNFENFLLEPAHPVYYNQQFLSSGFKPTAYYSSRKNSSFFCNDREVLRKENRLLNFGITIRNIDIKNFERELEKLYPFMCSAFNNNFLFTPISKDIFINKYLQFQTIINPEFVLIAENANGTVVGFVFCYDDLLNKKEKSLVIKTLARDRSEKWSGLGAVMANRVISHAKMKGYESIIHAFMLDDGNSSETSEKFFGTVYKKYVLYGLEL
jgi:hypothetical protein